jgi:hypothetical protein
MKVVDIANEIYLELGSPTTTNLAAISFWVRSNIGRLNNLINENFSILESTYEIINTLSDNTTEEISINAVAILKKMYSLHYYDTLIRQNIGASSTDSFIEIESDGMRVRKVSKTEVGRNLISIKKSEVEEFNSLVTAYKTNKAAPRQVAGDDTVVGYYIGKNYPLGITP